MVHHVIARFVNGQFLMADAEVRADYLRRLGQALGRTSWRLLAYALMSSHTHLALLAGVEPFHGWVQRVHVGFAGWLNRRRREAGEVARGPVFASRPKTILVSTERVGRLVAYLHNNPVRARVCSSPTESRWTSHRAYLGLDRPPPFLDVALGLSLAGFPSTASGRAEFDGLVRAHMGEGRDPELTAARAQEVLAASRAIAGCAVMGGSPIVAESGLVVPLMSRPETRLRSEFVGSPQAVLRVVAGRAGITVARMAEAGRSRGASAARRLAILVWQRLGRRPADMADALGVSRAAVSMAITRATTRGQDDRLLAEVIAELDLAG